MSRIRKERKACYVYSCELCSVTASAPDLFRAYERQQGHERTIGHMFAGIVVTFRDTYNFVAKALRNPPTQSDFGREA